MPQFGHWLNFVVIARSLAYFQLGPWAGQRYFAPAHRVQRWPFSFPEPPQTPHLMSAALHFLQYIPSMTNLLLVHNRHLMAAIGRERR